MSRCGGAGRPAGPSVWTARTVRLSSVCSMLSNSLTTATSSARTCGSISRPSSGNCRRPDVRGSAKTGRPNQRRRTRKDLLQAAARLMKQGRQPSLEEIAEEALVSRATAYRYFPSVEALLLEASFDVAIPEADDLFPAQASGDPVARL